MYSRMQVYLAPMDVYAKAICSWLVALRFEDELAFTSSLLLAPTDRPSVEYV
jgi:hypothetical protein